MDSITELTIEQLAILPPRTDWTEAEYLRLTDSTNRLVEFTDGRIEFLPMPTDQHQTIAEFLFMA